MDLKKSRQLHGLSQMELAEKAGTFQPVISYLEAGKRYPKADIREKIEAVLGKVDWIETRMQGPIGTGSYENESAEDMLTRALYIYIKSGAGPQDIPARCQFVKDLVDQMQSKFSKMR